MISVFKDVPAGWVCETKWGGRWREVTVVDRSDDDVVRVKHKTIVRDLWDVTPVRNTRPRTLGYADLGQRVRVEIVGHKFELIVGEIDHHLVSLLMCADGPVVCWMGDETPCEFVEKSQ